MTFRAVTFRPARHRGRRLGLAPAMVVAAGLSTLACHSASDTSKASAVEDTGPPAPADALVAADLHHVDVADIVRQAHARAVAENSHARLTYVVGFNAQGGLVDATTSNAAGVDYVYRYLDPTKPPGQDTVEGHFAFKVSEGRLIMIPAPPTKSTPSYIDEPTCSSRSASQTAVESGVPADAVATWEMSRSAWSLRVKGHPEYARQIDATTCKLVK